MRFTKIQKFLRTLRVETGETQAEMAQNLGISPSYLSQIEAGRRNVPTWLVNQFTKVYNISKEQQQFLISQRVCRDNAKAMQVLLEMQQELFDAKQMTFTKLEVGQWVQGHLNKLKGE